MKKPAYNPATGRTKAERALGKEAVSQDLPKGKPVKKKKTAQVASSLRMNTPGIFNGRRGAYGRYSASPAASDVIKKAPRREK
jgi:hypothetical protein